MTLRSRLALMVGLAVAVSMIAVAIGAGTATRVFLLREVDGFLDQRAREITAGGFTGSRFDPVDPRRRGPGGFPVRLDAVTQVVTEAGIARNLFGDVVLPVTEVDLEVASGERPPTKQDADGLDGAHYRVITTPIEGGAVQIGRDLEEIDSAVQSVRRLLFFFGLIGTALAALVAWMIATRATAPVRRLTAAAEQVAETKELDPDIEVEGNDEVGRLASSFREMLSSLSISKAQQQRLVMDASHELRTPLTSLRTNLEVLQRTPDIAADDRRELMSDLEFEVTELSNLVGELVDLATDADTATELSEAFDLAEMVAELAERTQRRTGRRVEIHVDGDSTVTAARGEVERAVLNLLDNADKFSPAGAPLAVHVAERSVAVRDHGPGVADEDKPHVFDRFFRSTSARSKPGSGLGLSIVAQVARHHGGTTFVRDAEGDGAVIGFTIGPDPSSANQAGPMPAG